MRIAILGTRGIPARYGGFETLAEELSAGLAARGHDVTVYTRTRYAEAGLAAWRGAKIRVLPTAPTKYLDTVVHGVLSGVDAAFERFDAVLLCNAINAGSSFLPRLFSSGRTRVVLNVDGLERNRRKWNTLGKLAYRVSESLSTILPDAVVTDARVIQDYYRSRHGCDSTFIPYGGDLPAPEGRSTLERLGLLPEKYVLYVSRLEPENNAEEVVREYREVPGETPLVVVGDAPYGADYIARLKAGADGRVRFPARSTARATGSCSRTPPCTCRRRRSAARIRRSWRRWATGASFATTRLRRTRRSPAAPPCLSTPTRRGVWRACWPASWMIRPVTPYGKNGRANACGRDIVGRMSFAGTSRFLKGGATSHNIPEASGLGPRPGYVRC